MIRFGCCDLRAPHRGGQDMEKGQGVACFDWIAVGFSFAHTKQVDNRKHLGTAKS